MHDSRDFRPRDYQSIPFCQGAHFQARPHLAVGDSGVETGSWTSECLDILEEPRCCLCLVTITASHELAHIVSTTYAVSIISQGFR